MLHIVWMVLKFLLLILGVILGLLLFLLLLILFCPVRYQLQAAKKTESYKEIQGEVSVSWLFRLIRVKLGYIDGKIEKSMYLFGISVFGVLDWINHRKAKKQKRKNIKPEEQRLKNTSEQIQNSVEQPIEELVQEDAVDEVSWQDEDTVDEDSTYEETEAEIEDEALPKGTAVRNPFQKLWDKIRALPGKIKEIYQNIDQVKKRLEEKLEWWKRFLGHTRTKKAVELLKKSVIQVLRHMFPTRISGNIRFGNENPQFMGTVLMYLSITIPFHKNRIHIEPVFDGSNVLTGEVKLKGRVYAIVFLITAIKIYFDKNIRFVIRHWKNKEE